MIAQIVFIFITFILAYIDNSRIIKTWGEKVNIKHDLSFLLFLIPVTIFLLFFHQGLKFVIASILIRALFYDIFLNKLRKLPYDYISDTTSSAVDKIERKIFGKNFAVEKLTYLILLILCNLV